jgi:hypothetical protein
MDRFTIGPQVANLPHKTHPVIGNFCEISVSGVDPPAKPSYNFEIKAMPPL